jgi:hypothetical protein
VAVARLLQQVVSLGRLQKNGTNKTVCINIYFDTS